MRDLADVKASSALSTIAERWPQKKTDTQILDEQAIIAFYIRQALSKGRISCAIAMEWGYRAAEKGWNLEKAQQEFSKFQQ